MRGSKRLLAVATATAALSFFRCEPADAGALPVLDIPKIDNIVIDGKTNDWVGRSFEARIAALATQYGEVDATPGDFSVSVRVCWNKDGMCALFVVNDDSILEAPEESLMVPYGDAVGIYVINASTSRMLRAIISPGVDPQYPELRSGPLLIGSEEPVTNLTVDAVGVRTDGGYVVEAQFPWTGLEVDPVEGMAGRLQLFVSDMDSNERNLTVAVWYPALGTHTEPAHSYPIRLAATPSPAWLPATAWRVLSESGRLEREDAQILFDQALEKWPREPHVCYEAGCFLFDKDSAKAARLFGQASRGVTDEKDAFLLADALFRRAALENALKTRMELLDSAMKAVHGRRDFKYNYLRARILFSRGFFILQSNPTGREGFENACHALEYAKEHKFTEFYPQIAGMVGRYHLAKKELPAAREAFENMLGTSSLKEERCYALRMLAKAKETEEKADD